MQKECPFYMIIIKHLKLHCETARIVSHVSTHGNEKCNIFRKGFQTFNGSNYSLEIVSYV